MLRYYYINKEWILSPTARRIYRISAALSLMLFLIRGVVAIGGSIPSGLLPVLKALVFLGVVGAATTMVAMEYFFFGFDNTSIWKKAFWFFVLLIPPLGPPLYCFIVYSKSNLLLPDSSLERAGPN